ncbi:hypothetical protein [Streptomyces huiliensis]|uniref:hypothetical protein n=1 Tax=Streptomyces huiliensis TaxID=2876027 RepID=UPI001CC00DC0|nr:hypothetical protein [Streptomyces huiliensis]MBZ4318081.1 hypothetical protein [Streptomyces huiliensis]
MTKKKRPRRHNRPSAPEPLPGYGTTWVDRGAPYWWRRAKWTLFWLFLSLVSGVMGAGFLWGIAEEGPLALAITAPVVVTLGGVTAHLTILEIRRADGEDVPESRLLRMSADTEHLLLIVAVVLAVALALLGTLEVALSPILFCFVFPHFIRSLGRYALGEREHRGERKHRR